MEVFLVPVSAERHELYCEVDDDDDDDASGAAGAKPSWWNRQVARFRELIREADAERDRRAQGQPGESRGIWRYIVGKIAEAVAEQRLLWRLQKELAVQLNFPDDLDGDRALAIARESVRRDFEKHRRWLGIDTLVLILFLPLTVIPGPNFPALYFTFRAIGHFFSMRGAKRGLDRVTWTPVVCRPLSGVRAVLELDGPTRRARLDEIGRELSLERLPGFVERLRATIRKKKKQP
jgi:K+-H+ exchange-related protein